jgi:hypothetical protein
MESESKIMEVKERLDRILDLAGDVAETEKDRLIIKFMEGATKAASTAILGVVVLLVGVLILMFVGLGFAWWIGRHYGNSVGLFIIGGVFSALVTTLILLANNTILPAIRNLIIRKIYEDQEL